MQILVITGAGKTVKVDVPNDEPDPVAEMLKQRMKEDAKRALEEKPSTSKQAQMNCAASAQPSPCTSRICSCKRM